MIRYAELATATNFSFLRGASHASDLVARALELGHVGIGIADRNTVAGVVKPFIALKQALESYREYEEEHATAEAWMNAEPPGWLAPSEPRIEISEKRKKEREAEKAKIAELGSCVLDFKLVLGSRLIFVDDTPDIIVYPEDRRGWGNLCRLLTVGNSRSKTKAVCELYFSDLATYAEKLLLIVMPDDLRKLPALLGRLREFAPGSIWIGATMHRHGSDRRRLARLATIGRRAKVPLLAVNDVIYHSPEQRPLQDVLTCIREGVTIERAGCRLEANAERHLKEPQEMARLFRGCEEAIEEAQHFLDRIEFSLSDISYNYPEEPVPVGKTPQEYLEELTWKRAEWRYAREIPQKVEHALRKELALIGRRDDARYFLTIFNIVEFAESKGILCQGRGSAANSAVCYALGITGVDPNEVELLFDRFMSEGRKEPPDIDVDFEHERREEVIQYLYKKYGRHRAGIAATVISYRARSAIRDVGKVFSLSEDITAKLTSLVWGSWGEGLTDGQIVQAGLDPSNPTLIRAVHFARQIISFPRHLSQHVGGFVLTQDRLDELVPIGHAAMDDRTFIEWDKDDIDALNLMKVDVLALGMLTCIRKAFELIEQTGGPRYGLADIQSDKDTDENKAVYAMLEKGHSIGVFQVESRAQMNMLPRMKPKEIYDLVIQVAIVRPGPIQGNMVHPYLKRRNKEEEPIYPSPKPPHDPDELQEILKRTLGVPLFQEQAMKLAMVAAEFTGDEANGLRRAMATFRHMGTIHKFEDLMVERMIARGYEREFAQRCFDQIRGFGEYGFPESHAASFAKLVYISAWIKCHHPAIFACALLNSQPMGFYAPAQIVREAQEVGRVKVLPVDINASFWDNTLERLPDRKLALRLGFRQVDGITEKQAQQLTEVRGLGYASIEELALRSGLPISVLSSLADADTIRSIRLDRREAAWAVRRLPANKPLPLFAAADTPELAAEPDANLPAMPLSEHVAADYQTLRLSLKGHPMGSLRTIFMREGVLTCRETCSQSDGAWVKTAGVVLVRQRPGKGNAIFVTLEDETGIINVVLWTRNFERFRREVMGARLMLVEGRLQRSKEGVVHLMGERVFDRSEALSKLSENHEPEISMTRSDEIKYPQMPRGRHPRNVRILPKSRDFH